MPPINIRLKHLQMNTEFTDFLETSLSQSCREIELEAVASREHFSAPATINCTSPSCWNIFVPALIKSTFSTAMTRKPKVVTVQGNCLTSYLLKKYLTCSDINPPGTVVESHWLYSPNINSSTSMTRMRQTRLSLFLFQHGNSKVMITLFRSTHKD